MSTNQDKFVMPEGASCDVPGCGSPATDALVSGGHVYLCRPHWEAITQDRMKLPSVRHDYWNERKASS